MTNKAWGSEIEQERRRRIQVAVWAYAYEIEGSPLVDDATYDSVCSQVNKNLDTGSKKYDAFFKDHFEPYTGMWVHRHPDLKGLKRLAAFKRANN